MQTGSLFKENQHFFCCLFVFSSMLFFLAESDEVEANPEGGSVSAGNAIISKSNQNTLDVNQIGEKAVIDWRSFNIGQGEQTNFVQPSASSIILNRIDGRQGASEILGKLTANGQVWLINPAGIMFGLGAQVDVGGLVASTANISNDEFMSGNYKFVQSSEFSGSIINKGTITTRGNGMVVLVASESVINTGTITTGDAGIVALVAPWVENQGVINAHLGHVTLGSSSTAVIDFYGDRLISFDTGVVSTKSGTAKTGVSNSGAIIADGGKVSLTAGTAKTVIDNVINMEGYIQANSVAESNGEIILSGGAEGVVQVSGNIAAAGGTVKILGNKVAMTGNANVNVSGEEGGGTILIGGNAHGAGSEQTADATFIDKNVRLSADALTDGNGGKVVVWSNEGTNFYGTISARGGKQGGNGGWVEVSGGNLNYEGVVDTQAPMGQVGKLLLDPKFLVIKNTKGSDYNGTNNLFSNNAEGTNTITATSLNESTADITLQANTDITFSDAVTLNTLGKSITVKAGRSIIIKADISTNNGDINMTANDSDADLSSRASGSGSITMSAGTSLNAGTGNITLTVGSGTEGGLNPGDITLRDVTGGAISLSTPGDVTLNDGINATGTVDIHANTDGAGSQDFTMKAGSSISTTDTSSNAVNIQVNNANGGTGSAALRDITTGNGGTINIATNTGDNSTGGSITQTAGTNLNVGTGGTINLAVSTDGTSKIGKSNANILTTSNGGTVNLTMGSGGAYINNTGDMTLGTPTVTSDNYALSVISSGTLTLPAHDFSTGTGALTLASNGGALISNGNLTTGTGALTLTSASGMTIGHTLTSDGVITLNANQSGGSGDFVMTAGSSITTSNTGASAVKITVNNTNGGTGNAQLSNITTGNGGTITVSTAPEGNTTGGSITQLGNSLLSTNATGSSISGKVILTTAVDNNSAIGSVENNIQTQSGTLILSTGSRGAFINNIGNANGYNGSTTLNLAALSSDASLNVISAGTLTLPAGNISTGAGNLTLKSLGGTLTTKGDLTTTNGNITLVSSGLLSLENNLTTVRGTIALTGQDVTQANDIITKTVSGDIRVDAGTGTFTMNNNTQLLAGDATGKVGTISIKANNIVLNTSVGTAAQIGGSDTGTGLANRVLLQSGNATIGIAGGAGTFSLGVTELNTIRAKNVHIGSSTAGNISINAWTPGATFASGGVLTLETAGTITQGGGLDLSTSGANLLLRSGGDVILTQANNRFSSVAAVIDGTLQLVSNSVLTIARLSDDIGTQNGINVTGNVALASAGAINLGLSNVGGVLTVKSGGAITLNGNVTANSAGGDSIILSGTSFNNAGGYSLNTGAGRFLVWSSNPENDNRGGLAYNFKQYNANYGVTSVLGSGNGFLYTLAPTITGSLTGTVSKIYDSNTAASLTNNNYLSSGAVDGDTIILNNPTSGLFDTKNVGSNKNVSVSGVTLTSAHNGNAIVYGYQFSSPSINGNIGKITPATIIVTPNRGQNKLYGTQEPKGGLNYTTIGLLGEDTLQGFLGRAAGENVGSYNYSQGTLNSDGNYKFVVNSDTFMINPLSVIMSDQIPVVMINTDPMQSMNHKSRTISIVDDMQM